MDVWGVRVGGVVKVILMQEIDGLQVRHLQLASCLHFMGHIEVGFRLDTNY